MAKAGTEKVSVTVYLKIEHWEWGAYIEKQSNVPLSVPTVERVISDILSYFELWTILLVHPVPY